MTAWNPAVGLNTEPDGGSESGNGASPLAREAADRVGTLLLTGKGNQNCNYAVVESAQDEESPAQMGGAEGTRTPDPHTARPS